MSTPLLLRQALLQQVLPLQHLYRPVKWPVWATIFTVLLLAQHVSAESMHPATPVSAASGLSKTASTISTSSKTTPATTASLSASFEQILQKVRVYQTSQFNWQTQQSMANARVQQSALWANPSFMIEQTGLQKQRDQELAIGFSQPLDVFGQRRAAQNLAQLLVTELDLEQQAYGAELDLMVLHAWSNVALLQLETSLIAEQLEVSQQNLAATEKRYQAGSIAQVDVERVRMAHLENQRIDQQAALQLQVARKQLASFWGSDSNPLHITATVNELWSRATQLNTPISVSRSTPMSSVMSSATSTAISDVNASTSTALNSTDSQPMPNVFERRLQLAIQRQQANIAQLKAKSRPQPTLTLGFNRLRTAEQNTENQLRLGVEVPLNVFNRQRYDIQIAEAQQSLIKQQQHFYRQQNQRDIALSLTELAGLRLQFKQLDEAQVPLAIQVQQKTLAGFRLGKFAVTDVQQATTQLHDVRLRKVQLLKQAWQLSLEVQSARMGVPVAQITAKDALMQLNQRIWQHSNTFANQSGE